MKQQKGKLLSAFLTYLSYEKEEVQEVSDHWERTPKRRLAA